MWGVIVTACVVFPFCLFSYQLLLSPAALLLVGMRVWDSAIEPAHIQAVHFAPKPVSTPSILQVCVCVCVCVCVFVCVCACVCVCVCAIEQHECFNTAKKKRQETTPLVMATHPAWLGDAT